MGELTSQKRVSYEPVCVCFVRALSDFSPNAACGIRARKQRIRGLNRSVPPKPKNKLRSELLQRLVSRSWRGWKR